MSEYCTHLTECARLLRNDDLAAARAHLLVTCESSHPLKTPHSPGFRHQRSNHAGRIQQRKTVVRGNSSTLPPRIKNPTRRKADRHGASWKPSVGSGQSWQFLWHIILVEWQAKGKPIPDY